MGDSGLCLAAQVRCTHPHNNIQQYVIQESLDDMQFSQILFMNLLIFKISKLRSLPGTNRLACNSNEKIFDTL